MKKVLILFLCLLLCLLPACAQAGRILDALDDIASELNNTGSETPTPTPSAVSETPTKTTAVIDENGVYTSKEDVALYIHTYGKLPSNFITKKQAEALGWTSGSLEPYAKGKCIGGDYFGNYEHQLPTKKGRTYHECDIGTLGRSSRGTKRIVYSNDGLIYYTGDHYEHFTLLYGGD